jgi:hypothetical protein
MEKYDYKPVYRIAVCLSGQPRWWRHCVENIKQFFSPPNDPHTSHPVQTDYFIHTWNTNTWRFSKQPHQYFRNELHNDYEEIKERFNPIAIKQSVWKEGMFNGRAWDPMWYSFANSIALKKQYEIENNFVYDLVIKARLDVVYNPKKHFPIHYMLSKYCYTSNMITEFPMEYNYFNFDDVIFYGRSNTMDVAGNIFKNHKVKYTQEYINQRDLSYNLHPAASWYGPGTSMYYHLMEYAIHPTCASPFEYTVMRETIVKENLNTMTDYEKIHQLGRDWYI